MRLISRGLGPKIALPMFNSIFGGYNELFSYVGEVCLLGIPIFAMLYYALYVVITFVGIAFRFVVEIMGQVHLDIKERITESKHKT